MTNYEIADQFALLAKLMDIHGENAFKIKTYSIAAYNIEKLENQLSTMPQAELYATKGIGASIGKKIQEILTTGQIAVLTSLVAITPPGVIEMMQIKGIGPKKIATIWRELGIETVGELLYACNENRLTLYKGFGAKNQQSIKDAIIFYQNAQGSYLYRQVHEVQPIITQGLQKIFGEAQITLTGSYVTQQQIVNELAYVINLTTAQVIAKLQTEQIKILAQTNDKVTITLSEESFKIEIYTTNINKSNDASADYLGKVLLLTTSSKAFVEAYSQAYPNTNYNITTDAELFTQHNITYLPPYLRETVGQLNLAQTNKVPSLITTATIKGMIHNHSNWSDGTNTIAEMVEACIAAGYEYLVISDHSKSAYYAQGLNEQQIKEQHLLIDKLNSQYAPFKILKSIECDILNDGSLDYSDSILSTFDLVIASIHSNLKMTEEKAMQRLLAAVNNPYTTILGHPSGRLLLSRPAYPINYPQLIEACADNHVAIELNAHPSRLDVDWKIIPSILQADVPISINPDAHSTDGFGVIEYGIKVAQKAMVQASQNLSSYSLADLEEYLYEVRERKLMQS